MDPGNVVQSGGSLVLAVITQIKPITVIFTIPEDSLGPVVNRLHKNAKLSCRRLPLIVPGRQKSQAGNC